MPPRICIPNKLRFVCALAATPTIVIFLSSNLVNAGNLFFNMVFSRLMGPEIFGSLAVVLTAKLAVMGVLGSLQMAISQSVADTDPDRGEETDRTLATVNTWLFTGCAILGAGLLLAFWLFNSSPMAMALVAALPFGASLSVLRGVAYGRLDAWRIVLSANIEMLVRLAGAALAWMLGYGLLGVVAAISFSIFVGWLGLADMLPRSRTARRSDRLVVGAIVISALTFGLLQVAQVAALDGDVFLARIGLPAIEAGYVAALSLFQRIQFFACFALSGVLLPVVITAAREGRPLWPAIRPIALLFLLVTSLLLLLAIAAPERIVGLIVGSGYLAMAPKLWLAISASAAFTFSYLIATFLVALGDYRGVAIVTTGAVLQLGLMCALPLHDFSDLLNTKLMVQLLVSVALIACLRGVPFTRIPHPRKVA